MNITCKVDITPQQIADQFVTAFEGGSNYWLHMVSLVSPDRETLKETPWYSDPMLYQVQYVIRLEYDDAEKDGWTNATKDINQSDVERGLNEMAVKSPSMFAEVVNEVGDANTADVFLQYVLFGEVIYA